MKQEVMFDREWFGTVGVSLGPVLAVVVLLGLLAMKPPGSPATRAAALKDGELSEMEAGTGEGGQVREMLRETAFENGVRPPTNGANLHGPGSTVVSRWTAALPATADSSWRFVTVEESDRLNDNHDTPSVDGDRIVYASDGGSKRVEVDRSKGEVRIFYDTEQEWRGGCDMSLPDDGAEPRYLSGHAWNWPHLLLSQDIEDPGAPDGRFRPTYYSDATLRFEAELLSSAKGKPDQCPPESWGGEPIPDHCLFYAALVMQRLPDAPAPPPDSVSPPRIYALYPMFYSDGGEVYDGPGEPWLGLDPASHAVYFTADHVRLETGRAMDVAVDAQALTEEAVAAINDRHDAGLSADSYYVQGLLIGWEKWGAYRTGIRLRDLSFKATRDDTPSPVRMSSKTIPWFGEHGVN